MTEKDNSKRFAITGVKDATKIKKDLWNTIHSREKVNLNLLRDDDVDIVTIEGKDVIYVNVPQAEYTVCPIYINIIYSVVFTSATIRAITIVRSRN